MQNIVVANVAMPRPSSVRQACRPSHVAGTLIQSLFESILGAKALNIATSPRVVSV